MSLMWACLTLLEREEEVAASTHASDEAAVAYRPVRLDLFRVQDAIARVRGMLATADGPTPFRQCLPALDGEAPNVELRARSAVASTLVAVVELARAGEAALGPAETAETLTLMLAVTA